MRRDLDDTVETYEIRPAKVKYIDLCQHTEVSRSEFFGESDLKTLDVYGLTLELPDLVKVLFYNDRTDDSECEGIVIPRACVVSIEWLVPEIIDDPALHSKDGSVN